jgi:hypothetical protein
MNKQEHDQFMYDSIQEMLRQKKEREATPVLQPLARKKNIFKSLWKRVLRYFTT